MKTFILFSVFCLIFSFNSIGQKRGDHDITSPLAEIKDGNGDITQLKSAPMFVGRVQGVVGNTFHSTEINSLPTRSINKISGMTMGVQSIPGQDPIFKGSVGGTAYFVDGIRVRTGPIGVPGFTF
ncbi:MAG: hypothetical protein KA981_12305 [Bacteroidia bacterium]|jgi:hypothetical protein|nr:hypothetical protein [Bacteroidia bacterium]